MATDKLVAMNIFRRVAELGSFTRAADDLEITAATVSKHIAFLERDLDTRLINRTTRRMNLTDAGFAFLKRTQALLDELEDAELEARGFQAEPKGTIRLNVPMSFGLTHISEAIDSFLNRFPEIDIDLQLSDRMVDLVEQGVDIAIRVRRFPGGFEPDGQTTQKVQEHRLCITRVSEGCPGGSCPIGSGRA